MLNISNKIFLAENEFKDEHFRIWEEKEYPFKNSVQDIHAHDYVQLWYLRSGTCSYFIDGTDYPMKAGEICIVPQYVFHAMGHTDSSVDMVALEFDNSFIENSFGNELNNILLVNNMNIKHLTCMKRECVKDICKLIEESLEEYNNKKMYYRNIIRSNIIKILTLVAREYTNLFEDAEGSIQLGEYKKLILPALDYIYNNYDKEISLNDMYKLTNLSRSYFSLIFKKVTGRSFIEQQHHVRIMLLCSQLKSHSKLFPGSINQLAREVGYNDAAYFNRMFKRIMKCTPSEYINLSLQ